MVREETPRVLINKERVGGIGSGTDDVLLLGDCDDGVRKLAKACGWLDELEALWAKTSAKEARELDGQREEVKTKDKDEALEDEINKFTKDVDETLNLSRWHEDKVRNERLPTEPMPSTKSAQHEDKNGDLGHVFVSNTQDVQQATTPVIPQGHIQSVASALDHSRTTDKTDDAGKASKDTEG